jgi:hypothetical protein
MAAAHLRHEFRRQTGSRRIRAGGTRNTRRCRMNSKLIATALVGIALTAPAFAQGQNQGQNQGQQNRPSSGSSSSQGSGSQGSGSQGSSSQSASQGGSSASQSQQQAMSQQRLRQQLTRAGFQDVRVVDAAYLVEAKTEDGNTVYLMINPPASMPTASGAMRGSSSASGSTGGSSPSTGGGSGSSSSGGSRN